jgi:hypothetical protein
MYFTDSVIPFMRIYSSSVKLLKSHGAARPAFTMLQTQAMNEMHLLFIVNCASIFLHDKAHNIIKLLVIRRLKNTFSCKI